MILGRQSRDRSPLGGLPVPSWELNLIAASVQFFAADARDGIIGDVNLEHRQNRFNVVLIRRDLLADHNGVDGPRRPQRVRYEPMRVVDNSLGEIRDVAKHRGRIGCDGIA